MILSFARGGLGRQGAAADSRITRMAGI